jgi:hypothetical protein
LRAAIATAMAAIWCFGCARAPAAPPPSRPAQLSDELATRWLAPDTEQAKKHGAGASTVLASGAGAPGDSIGGRISLVTSDCALFLARGSRSIEDLDLFVYGDDGALLGGDETASAGASAVVCPPHPERIYAFARVAAGRGVFALSAQAVRPDAAERVALAVGAAGKLHEQALAGGWPGLEKSLAEHRHALGGEWRDARRVAIPLDPRVPTRTSAVVNEGECIDVLVLPSEEVAYVELTLLDDAGRIVGRAPSEERLPSVRACSSVRVELTLELRPHAGHGLAALLVSSTRDTQGLTALPGMVVLETPVDDPKVAQAFARNLTRAGYGVATPVVRGTTGVGRRLSTPIDLPDGCSRVDVVAAPPARGVDAWLWDGNGTLIAHDDGGARATLFGCGKDARARLDVEAVAHAGPYTVELRQVPNAAAILGQHPLAAGRLLERFSEAGRIGTPRDLPAPRLVTLSSARFITDEVKVPPGQCLDVGLALGVGAEGAELRLVDVEANEELALTRGNYSALAEACAIDRTRPLELRIELRAAAGAGDALLGKHPRPMPGR